MKTTSSCRERRRRRVSAKSLFWRLAAVVAQSRERSPSLLPSLPARPSPEAAPEKSADEVDEEVWPPPAPPPPAPPPAEACCDATSAAAMPCAVLHAKVRYSCFSSALRRTARAADEAESARVTSIVATRTSTLFGARPSALTRFTIALSRRARNCTVFVDSARRDASSVRSERDDVSATLTRRPKSTLVVGVAESSSSARGCAETSTLLL